MIKTLEKNKENLILGALSKPNTVQDAQKLSKLPISTVRLYIRRMVELGKVKDLETYPRTYRRIPRNQWPGASSDDSLDDENNIDNSLVAQVKQILTTDVENTDPVLKAFKVYLQGIEGGLPIDAAVNMINAASEAFKQIVKEKYNDKQPKQSDIS